MIFMQSLLILLVAIHVTNACQCGKKNLKWEEVICPKHGKTVVIATIINMESLNDGGEVVNAGDVSASNAKYQMRLNKTITSGSNKLDENSGIFTMMFPLLDHLCGKPLTVNKDYVIVGDVYQSSILFSNTCQLTRPLDEVSSANMLFLEGEKSPNCQSLKDTIIMADP